MMTFNRQGVRIEQCEGCRGIFLDRGELDQIINAEEQHYGGVGAQYGGHPSGGGRYGDSPGPYRGRPDSPPPYRGGHAPYRGGRYSDSPPPFGGRRRKRSFLGELFD